MLDNILLILDRDGVLNLDTPTGVTKTDELVLIDEAIQGVAHASKLGATVYVCTNQANVGRGLLTESLLLDFHHKILSAVKDHGGVIQEFFYCPHRPEDDCDCRKPNTKMLEMILSLHPDKIPVFVGDSSSDLEAATRTDIHSILIGTGKGLVTREAYPFHPFAMNFSELIPLLAALNYHHVSKTLLTRSLEIKENIYTTFKLSHFIAQRVSDNGVVLSIGNGGSCALSDHFVAELQIRFNRERAPLPAVSLSSQSSSITAASNDYSYQSSLLRPLESFMNIAPASILFCFSTSGKSTNIINAAQLAKNKGIPVVSYIGLADSPLALLSDYIIYAGHSRTPEVQDLHEFYVHQLCHQLDLIYTTDQ
ncbi:HAD-IIIA family hydrolase [Synechococcus sp. BS56D]|uniref:HAD-IIIA family hydrolase n=1 Tax=Synechococcus sp. BS56D TaxID=2055944 RepID=UPI0013869586|nr:HAD-IIIA family hydrolase [Synechococcus sp. BS56D]